jgi:hypothetical protein
MDMLCIAAAHDPIGYVAVAGRGLSETDIARMTGGSESEVHALLGALDQNGVFSRDRKGTIYSRRMVLDAKRAAIARKNGKNGGNPSLSSNNENSSSDKGADKPRLKPQEPLTIIQEPESSSSLRSEPREAKPKFQIPDWVPTPQWLAFLEMRKAKRKPFTDHAKGLLIAKLERLREAGHDPGAVLDQSTEHSWDSVFELKTEASNANGNYQNRKSGAATNHRQMLEGAFDFAGGEDGIAEGRNEPGGTPRLAIGGR